MKNRIGWLLSMLAIMTFTFGQGSAAATQIVTAKKPPVAVQKAAVPVKAKVSPKVAALNAPTSATDVTKVPHYFGPYPNWANSPQVLSDAVVDISVGTSTPVSYGNPLVERAYATDYATAVGALAPVFVVLPQSKLPAGMLQSFQTWNQGTVGASPTTSAGNVFHAYVLRPTLGTANAYTVVYDNGLSTVPTPVVSTGEVSTFTLTTPVAVAKDDVIGFYGEGIPLDSAATATPDTFSYPASADATMATNVAPAVGSTMTLGVTAGFPIYSTQNRTYSFAATVTPTVADPGTGATATATVNSQSGAISAVTVTSPGNGYLVPPTVTITAPGVTPTTSASATAQISSGVLTSIAVNETGFGFTAPAVTITGGNPTAGSDATAVASGGVDDLILATGGTGYATKPIVEFTLPDAKYCTSVPAPTTPCVAPTATATMTSAGVVNAVTVVTPGSGYASAPTVTITDAGAVNPTGATVTATIGIGQIDLTAGGAGYDSAPTVAINDTVGTADKGASATATVAVKGAVTGITVTTPGAGYLTPGLKKFVDTLAGQDKAGKNSLDEYIPTAIPDTTTYPGADYYEIGVVQYRQKFSSQLPATLLRGYVQLATKVVPGDQVPLTNANLDPKVTDAPVLLNGAQVLGVDKPHYLGPTIVATKNRPTRILFRNLLPTGVDGDLFLPVDTSVMGSGAGPNAMMLDPKTNVPMDMAPDTGLVTDGVRNPACGETPKPSSCYTENRATLHLHGGVTPWISDGTPHQWTTPSGETTDYPKGVSVSNVPDMADPGPGAETFFYTNQQSARLMFYHDHSWGITRLNVYAGEAAPYLITDDTEKALTAKTTSTTAGGALETVGAGTPLIIQDKTFVPDKVTMDKVDPTWNAAKWGGEGNLWTPHVYMPAQNPGSPSGTSAFGRWMYGPWFWPPAKDAKYPPIANPYYDSTCDPTVQPFCEPAQIPSTPNISVGMEAYNDTPIVNGTAYPTTTVDPKAYRYRILNAANDRFWNLQWYVADPTTGTLSEVAMNPAELAAAQTDPNVVPTPDTTKSPVGPSWVQIGNEGGFLPAPTVIANQPITWITDPTRFDFGNVDKHSLLLAPAERADVVVDFSQFRGKTLILYNDAPAAFPARQANQDFYTGGPDMTGSGGAPTTLPGYGPNTRTIMQVKVSTAAPALAFDRPNTILDRMGALNAAFAHHTDAAGKPAGVFESGSDPAIVGQAAYNSAYGTTFVKAGYCCSVSTPAAKCDGFARIQQQGGDLFKFDTLGAKKDGNGAQLSIPLQGKAIHDEMNSANFDEWGRMTANIGLEAPGATPLLQNIILYPYVNPATEVEDSTGMPSSLDVTPISTSSDGTQIWKITHNGVDTHPLHWHLYDVQVINRVTWDNIIMPPDPNELGWKETVRVSPLEDTYVALRPIVPTLPFGVPDSIRALNPAMPLGAAGSTTGPNGTEAGFNNTDVNGNPIAPIVNSLFNFGWEYVWHCHILSHEEMDMMRPVSVQVLSKLAVKPVLTATRDSAGVNLAWTDGTPVDYAKPSTWTNPGTAEIGFRVERAIVSNRGSVGAYSLISTALANATTYTDAADPALSFSYRVTAFNTAGGSVSTAVQAGTIPAAPTSLWATPQAGPQVSLSWRDNATTETGFVVERQTGTGAFAAVATPAANRNTGIVTYVDAVQVQAGTTYTYRVKAVNGGSASAYTNVANAVIVSVPSDPSGLAATSVRSGNRDNVTLTWVDTSSNETGFTLQRATNATFTAGLNTSTLGANVLTATQTGLNRGVTYYYRICAFNLGGPSGWNGVSILTP